MEKVVSCLSTFCGLELEDGGVVFVVERPLNVQGYDGAWVRFAEVVNDCLLQL